MFETLQRNHYKLILADPPWRFLTHSEEGKERSSEKHYSCMSHEDIKGMPVADLAADDVVLLLWVPDPNLRVVWRKALQ